MRAVLGALFLIILLAVPARAEMDYSSFGKLPVLHEGRVKPVDSFARLMLRSFSGSERLDGKTAQAWLAGTMFDPATAVEEPVFRLFKPELLGLPPRNGRLYSYAEVAPAIQRRLPQIRVLLDGGGKDLTEAQEELIRLHDYTILYEQLLRGFTFVLPTRLNVPEPLAKEWGIDPQGAIALQDLAPYEQRLEAKINDLVQRKGEDLLRYSEDERAAALFSYELSLFREAGMGNVLFRVIPAGTNGQWVAPWAVARDGAGSPEAGRILSHWRDLAEAYQAQDGDAWAKAVDALAQTAKGYTSVPRLWTEALYNGLHPLGWAMGAYVAAFLMTIFAGMQMRPALLRRAAIGVCVFALTAHVAAMAMRVFILMRPPVGTLYESILFVAMICVIAALFLERRRPDGMGLGIGALCGGLLLFVAEAFAADDTLKMLVAVLNTNFWLSTHVLCITAGYGWCIIASALAHVCLYLPAERREPLYRTVSMMSLVALLFTAVGTILGGIWADQSWGRFWGWDPKENGALLIVLWLIWILHARIGGHLRREGILAATAALSVIVALAWFGVNLLSVGLHSYGFITGVAGGLAAFCATEGAVIAWLYLRARKAAA